MNVGDSNEERPRPALSLQGIKWYLVEPVDADDTQFEVRARLEVGSEIIHVIKCDYAAGTRDVSGPVIEVVRGAEGTTAASHAAGATYTWLGAPES